MLFYFLCHTTPQIIPIFIFFTLIKDRITLRQINIKRHEKQISSDLQTLTLRQFKTTVSIKDNINTASSFPKTHHPDSLAPKFPN